jgi:hypothetical protein
VKEQGPDSHIASQPAQAFHRVVCFNLLEGGKLKNAADLRFLEQECTGILLKDGIITQDPHNEGAFLDRSSKQWYFLHTRAAMLNAWLGI